MTRHLLSTCAAVVLLAGSASAQQKATITGVPDIPFTSVPNFLKLPAGEYLGESVAVATNSKGNIFVYHRRDTTRLFEFDKNGTFIKEIGKGYYGFEFAHSVRVDKDDNIWTVDEGTNLVTKFSPEGQGADGDRPQAAGRRWPRRHAVGPNPPAQKYILCRPSDVGFDPQGNIFISDGYCNNRVVKYDKNGRFVAQAGSEKAGKELGEFNLPHGLQVDGRGHVWVADRTNNRYQELDNNLKPIKGDYQSRHGMDVVHLRRTASVRLLLQLEPERQSAGFVAEHRRDLQGGTGWHGARQVRQAGQEPAWLSGGPQDRLPQSQRS